MAVNVLRYRAGKETLWGLSSKEGVIPIGSYGTTADFLDGGAPRAREIAEELRRGAPFAARQVDPRDLLSPITVPCRVVCQGLNYREHMVQGGVDPDRQTFNTFFTKSSASVSPPNADILRPRHVQLLDYEIELGLVIGKEIAHATEISAKRLHEYVAGLVMGNDVSARDVQLPQGQFFKGKSYRTFCPLGPYLCLLDPHEFSSIDQLDLRLSVNDQVRQEGNTRDLVYKPAQTLTELSEFCDLNKGDVLLTGTPSGSAVRPPASKLLLLASRLMPEATKWQLFVKNQRKNPNYLQPGDELEGRIRSQDGSIDLGVQHNRVVQA